MKALAVFIGIGLLVYAVIDCSRTPDEAVPSSLSRAGWLVMIILLPFVGPVFWLLASRTDDNHIHRNEAPDRRTPNPGGPAGRTQGPVGPDDDPDFLRGL